MAFNNWFDYLIAFTVILLWFAPIIRSTEFKEQYELLILTETLDSNKCSQILQSKFNDDRHKAAKTLKQFGVKFIYIYAPASWYNNSVPYFKVDDLYFYNISGTYGLFNPFLISKLVDSNQYTQFCHLEPGVYTEKNFVILSTANITGCAV